VEHLPRIKAHEMYKTKQKKKKKKDNKFKWFHIHLHPWEEAERFKCIIMS